MFPRNLRVAWNQKITCVVGYCIRLTLVLSTVKKNLSESRFYYINCKPNSEVL